MTNTDQPISGPLIAALRAALDAGESQRALAERLGVPRPNLTRWLGGRATMTVETADRIAAELGLRLVR